MVAVFNSMTFALKVTPLAVRSLSEGAVAIRRFQVSNARPVNMLIRSYPESPELNWLLVDVCSVPFSENIN